MAEKTSIEIVRIELELSTEQTILLKNLAAQAYREGYEDAVNNYAIWKDGVRIIGCMATPAKKVIEELQTANLPIRY